MIVIAVVVAVFLAAAAGMALVRIIRGPSTLDRIVGTDVLLAITVGAIATEVAYSRDATGLPILLGLSLLGAVGSIAVARFADPAARRAGATTGAFAVSAPYTSPGDNASADAVSGSNGSADATGPAAASGDRSGSGPSQTSAPKPVVLDSGLGDAANPDPGSSPPPEPGATPLSGTDDPPSAGLDTTASAREDEAPGDDRDDSEKGGRA
ncbi:monovalent cation/H+ antiporter complex subunit F [Actinoplanes sp. G11-F43]|uniref:monovalent cation/H+ antiporter complex subunit F n=1 Tax=Actinoplanes sp. G11-F43 TaxID=3424130 RepID=UPI003D32CD3C